jgi:NAD(P)-dependent dehydrogenase (short-subunit alcohol dehydrogenase family)
MQTIAVIGGSSGIGQAICHRLKDEYQVVNMSRRKNDEVENVYCDVESYESVKDSFSFCVEKYGKPSILVYSAGWVQPESVIEIEPETWQKQINVNLTGAFYATKEFVKVYEKSQNSKIVYISSTSALRPSPGWSAYSSAKSGLIEFASCMAEELKPSIKVYCISPGRCNTRLRQVLCPNEDGSKIMQPFDVAQIVYGLLQDPGLLDSQNLIVRKSI